MSSPLRPEELAKYIDHTLLKPEATTEQIERLCGEARQYGFAAVCVNPCNVATAADALEGSSVAVCTVVGFPLGANMREIKSMEAGCAIDMGAREIDMVLNVGALKGGDDDRVLDDIQGVVEICSDSDAVCKVIIECALLSSDEKVRACQLAREAGAHFVKTSTGFASGGATVEDVALMRKTVGPELGVKAAGGIRTLADVEAMLAAGATRIGASASVQIMQQASSRGG